MSYNVTAAVAPSGQPAYKNTNPSKPNCVETAAPQPNKAPQSFPFYKAPINQLCESPVEKSSTRGATTLFQDGLTDQGYFDLKFYHNKLW